jgi:death-on-curing protein
MKTDLADSALHAPAGSWSNEDFYPDFIDKAAVLPVRLAKHHPLRDGNKRAAWVTLRLFIEMNGWTWRTYPGVDEAEQARRVQHRVGRGDSVLSDGVGQLGAGLA